MKFSGKVGNEWAIEQMIKFRWRSGSPLDTGTVFRIRYYWKMQKVVNGHKSAAHTDSPDGGTGKTCLGGVSDLVATGCQIQPTQSVARSLCDRQVDFLMFRVVCLLALSEWSSEDRCHRGDKTARRRGRTCNTNKRISD